MGLDHGIDLGKPYILYGISEYSAGLGRVPDKESGATEHLTDPFGLDHQIAFR